MEDREVQDGDSDEPTAFGHQPTEALPSSAALRERPVSGPDERAGCPGARDSVRERTEDAGDPGEAFYSGSKALQLNQMRENWKKLRLS